MPTTYAIFARKEYPEPLVYIGSIDVDDPAEVSKLSLEKYGPEDDWIEMLAVPHQDVITVFSENGEDDQ